MQRYNINNRLAYLSGGVQSAGGMWPSVAAGDWWDIAGETCLAAYQAKGAASQAASYTNLANPGTYDLTESATAPTWDSTNGWQGNGSSAYLNTGIAGNATVTTIVRFSGYTSGSMSIYGCVQSYSGTWGPSVSMGYSTTQREYAYGVVRRIGGNQASGVMGMSNRACYLNGASDGTIVGGGLATNSIYILARQISSGAGGQYFDGYVQAFACYSTELDATQMATLSSAMAAL